MTTSKITIAILALMTASVFAGWEDTGAAQQKNTAQASRPQSQAPAKFRAAGEAQATPMYAAGNTSEARGSMRNPAGSNIPPELYNPFFDAGHETEQWYRFSLTGGGDVKYTGKKLAFADIDARFALGDFRNVCQGDILVDMAPSLRFLTQDAYIGPLPSTYITVPVDIAWIWRYLNGWSFELGFAPGIYTAGDAILSGSTFGIPLRGCFYYSFNEEVAIRAGLEVRPGWDQVVMPLVGIAWAPTEMFRAEIGLPRTLVDMRFGRLGIFGEVQWRNVTFGMDNNVDGQKVEDITFNDWLFGAGVAFDFTDTCRLSLEVGMLTGRDISFDVGDSIDVGNAPFVGFMLGSQF